MNNRHFSMTVLGCCIWSMALHADESVDKLQSIEVLSDRLLPSTNFIGAKDQSPGGESTDALSNVSGVSAGRKGGHGSEVSIRGQTETRLNILLDGAYVHGGCPSRMDPPTSYAPLATYESVTVIKGMQTLEYGSGGAGGTVLFERITERFEADEGTRGLLEAGYRDNGEAWEVTADVATGNETGFVRVIGSMAESDSYEDGNGQTVRSGFEDVSGTAIFGYTPSEDERLTFSIERQETEDILFPGLGMDAPYANNTTTRLSYKKNDGIGFFNTLKAEVYRSQVDHLMDNYSLRTAGPMRLSAPSDSNTTGGRVVTTMNSGIGQWKMGLDVQINERDAERRTAMGALQSVLWPGVEIAQTGIFAELNHALQKDRRLVAGLRFDHVEASADQSKINTNPNASPSNADIPANLYAALYEGAVADNVSENNIGGLLRFEQDLAENAGLVYAGLSRSVRTADATERYLGAWMMRAPMVRVGNPDIEPEQHHQIELGSQLRGNAWTLDTSIYYNQVSDYILRDRNAQNQQVYRNIDATLIGGEVDVRYEWNKQWSSNAGLSYVEAENTTDNLAIAQTPPMEASVSMDYTNNAWQAGLKVHGAVKQTRVDLDGAQAGDGLGLDARKTPAWAILDLYAHYQVNDIFALDFGMDNTLDATYAQHLNHEDGDGNTVQVNEPGRTAWLKLRAEF